MSHMSSLSQSPTPADLSITPRDMRFGRDDKQGRWWLNGDPIASAFHTALSVTFPRGVIDRSAGVGVWEMLDIWAAPSKRRGRAWGRPMG